MNSKFNDDISESEIKQAYLRNEIIDKDYNPDEFLDFMIEKNGEKATDLDSWSMEDLKKAVSEFKIRSRRKLSVIPITTNERKDSLSPKLSQARKSEY
jgi:hypothetical protein